VTWVHVVRIKINLYIGFYKVYLGEYKTVIVRKILYVENKY